MRGLSLDAWYTPTAEAVCSTLHPFHSRKAWYVQSQRLEFITPIQSASQFSAPWPQATALNSPM